MKKITIGIIIGIGMFMLTPSVRGASYSVTYTGFLTPGTPELINRFDFVAGDEVHWNFRTFGNPFNVRLTVNADYLSLDKTSDSSSFTVTSGGSYVIYIKNIDTTESGSYEVNINVNPTSPSISGFNLFIILGVISITALIIKKKIN